MIRFQLRGVVREADSGVGLPDLFLKAYDKDLLFDDLLDLFGRPDPALRDRVLDLEECEGNAAGLRAAGEGGARVDDPKNKYYGGLAGSALTIDDGQSHFDGIVFAELAPRKWMPGSDGQ